MRTRAGSRFTVWVAALALLSGGCAAIQRSDAMGAERMLAAAGFQMKFADTPALLAQAQALPQRKLTPVPHEGDVRWVYADAKFCKCIYAGSQQAYGRYQKLAIKQQIAEEEENASMNWGAWGPWGPWY